MFSVGFFCFLFAALTCSVFFGKGGGVNTGKDGAGRQQRRRDVSKDGADVNKDGEDVGKDEAGRQCASSQFFPVPQSAMSGTLMAKACSISLMTSSFTRSSSLGGTLKLSSSCT